jgi:hypothetical protein
LTPLKIATLKETFSPKKIIVEAIIITYFKNYPARNPIICTAHPNQTSEASVIKITLSLKFFNKINPIIKNKI